MPGSGNKYLGETWYNDNDDLYKQTYMKLRESYDFIINLSQHDYVTISDIIDGLDEVNQYTQGLRLKDGDMLEKQSNLYNLIVELKTANCNKISIVGLSMGGQATIHVLNQIDDYSIFDKILFLEPQLYNDDPNSINEAMFKRVLKKLTFYRIPTLFVFSTGNRPNPAFGRSMDDNDNYKILKSYADESLNLENEKSINKILIRMAEIDYKNVMVTYLKPKKCPIMDEKKQCIINSCDHSLYDEYEIYKGECVKLYNKLMIEYLTKFCIDNNNCSNLLPYCYNNKCVTISEIINLLKEK